MNCRERSRFPVCDVFRIFRHRPAAASTIGARSPSRSNRRVQYMRRLATKRAGESSCLVTGSSPQFSLLEQPDDKSMCRSRLGAACQGFGFRVGNKSGSRFQRQSRNPTIFPAQATTARTAPFYDRCANKSLCGGV